MALMPARAALAVPTSSKVAGLLEPDGQREVPAVGGHVGAQVHR
jgi:hypothetical protein